MIRLKERTRARLMMLHGFAMVALGLALFFIRATMVFYYAFGCAVAIMVVAAALLFVALVNWICAVGLGSRQVSRLRGLLFLNTAVAAGGIFLFLHPGATIRTLGYVIAAYALLLGIGKFHLARYWDGPALEHLVMYVLAVIALSFSALLLVVAGRDEREVLAMIGLFFLFIGLQMLLSIFYLQQRVAIIGAESSSK